MNNLSEESLEALRGMFETEAWRVYEQYQQARIRELRVLAKGYGSEERIKYYDIAQGREDALTDIKQVVYGR